MRPWRRGRTRSSSWARRPSAGRRRSQIQVRTAEFVGAVGEPGQDRPTRLPQVAFGGRSNVGKSSLINAVLGRKKLARTSRRPGKTQEINFYVVNGEFAVVDLPGYGFARAPQEVRQRWGPLIESYLATADELLGVVHLIDCRRGPTSDDRQLFDYLARLEIPALFVLTKVDKLNRSERREAVEAVRETLEVPEDQILLTSALTGEGTDDLLDSVEALVEGRGEGGAPPEAGKEGRGAVRPGG